MKTKNYID